jgi:hypothetical protein
MASGPPEPPEPGPCCLAPGAAAGGLAGTPGRMRCARPKSPAMQGWEGGRERGRTVGTDGARRTKFDDPVLGDEEIRRLEIAVAHTCRRWRRRAERSPLLVGTVRQERGRGSGRGQWRRATHLVHMVQAAEGGEEDCEIALRLDLPPFLLQVVLHRATPPRQSTSRPPERAPHMDCWGRSAALSVQRHLERAVVAELHLDIKHQVARLHLQRLHT